MPRAAVAAFWAGVAMFALGGCGTVHNFTGDDAHAGRCEVFGGVRADVRTGVKCLKEPADGKGDGAMQDMAKLDGWYLLAVDLPLSAVGDTVTLPWAVLCQVVGTDAGEARPRHKAPRTAETAEAVSAEPGGNDNP